MAENIQVNEQLVRPLREIFREIEGAVDRGRAAQDLANLKIKDIRWTFDQVSAKMNQSIYNDQKDLIHSSCLDTVAVLVEILART